MSLQGTEAVREKIGVEPTGLPAKTGVGGGIVAVVPGKFAIATFSARLNEAGNSIRGLRAIRDIAGEMGVGIYVGIYGPNPE